MAKTARIPNQPPQEPRTILLEDDTVSAESLNPALEALYAELGIEGETEATVHVSMLATDGKGVEAGVWKGDPGEYDLQTIAREHGSGSYRVKVYVRNPDGSKPCRANKIFAWKLTPAEERARKTALNAAINPAPIAPPADALTPEKIATMIAQGIAAAMPKTPTRKEILEEMKVMSEMFRPAGGGGEDSFAKQLRNFQIFGEVMKGLSPQPRIVDEDGKVDNGAVLMKGLEVLSNAFTAAKTAQAAPVAQPIPEGMVMDGSGQLVPAIPAAPAETDQVNEDQDMLMFKMQLKAAVALAKNNGDAKEFAGTVFELLPDDVIVLLQTDPQWMQKLSEVNPDVLKYPDWFNTVATEILRLEAEDQKEGGSAG